MIGAEIKFCDLTDLGHGSRQHFFGAPKSPKFPGDFNHRSNLLRPSRAENGVFLNLKNERRSQGSSPARSRTLARIGLKSVQELSHPFLTPRKRAQYVGPCEWNSMQRLLLRKKTASDFSP